MRQRASYQQLYEPDHDCAPSIRRFEAVVGFSDWLLASPRTLRHAPCCSISLVHVVRGAVGGIKWTSTHRQTTTGIHPRLARSISLLEYPRLVNVRNNLGMTEITASSVSTNIPAIVHCIRLPFPERPSRIPQSIQPPSPRDAPEERPLPSRIPVDSSKTLRETPTQEKTARRRATVPNPFTSSLLPSGSRPGLSASRNQASALSTGPSCRSDPRCVDLLRFRGRGARCWRCCRRALNQCSRWQ